MILIADISSNHCGDINKAKQLISEAKECKVDFVKFQIWDTDEFINGKQFNLLKKIGHQSDWKKSVFETFKDYQIPKDWIQELAEYCKKMEIGFMCTPYNLKFINEIDKYSPIHKIGSGDITYAEMLLEIGKKNKPVLLGTGASNINEVIFATNILQSVNRQIVLMQCNSNYETSEDKINYSCINVLKSYKIYFPDIQLGISDHSKSIYPIALAQSLGAVWCERHFTGSLQTNSPDSKFSMTIMDMKYLIKELNICAKILGNTFKEVTQIETESRIIQRRALYATKDLKTGHTITKDDIIALRPCLDGYLTPLFNLEGMKLKKDIKKDDPFTFQNTELKDKN
jgi:sialic acid synthase SpsE